MEQDKQDGNTVASFYRDAMVTISAQLTVFYQEYATKMGLTLQEVDQEVNDWDLNQFKLAINTMMHDNNPNDELAKRLQVAYAQATVSKRNMMDAVVVAGIAIASDRADQYGQEKIADSYKTGYYEHSGQQPLDVPTKVAQPLKDYSNRIWLHNDQMNIRMQNTLNRGLQRGLNRQDWKQLMTFKSVAQPRMKDNLASEMNKELTQTQSLLKSENSGADNRASVQAYRDQGIFYGVMVTQPGFCDVCGELAADGPWLLEDAPNIPDDTHPNCRCNIVGTDVHGTITAPLIETDVA